MKYAGIEVIRKLNYFLIISLLILNVFDAALTGYFAVSYGAQIEQNLLMARLMSNMGLAGFQLAKCGVGTFVLLYLWFIVQNVAGSKVLSFAFLCLLGLFAVFSYIVIAGLMQLP